eukprot:288053-Alexandrium_andersonii.AAC.1
MNRSIDLSIRLTSDRGDGGTTPGKPRPTGGNHLARSRPNQRGSRILPAHAASPRLAHTQFRLARTHDTNTKAKPTSGRELSVSLKYLTTKCRPLGSA